MCYYHYLDNLRVFAFLLLILTHCALVYSRERWNIESAGWTIAATLLLQSFQEWRLPLLFVVSGLGLHVSMTRGSHLAYLERRVIRIGLPLLIGIGVILPLQNYLIAQWQLHDSYTPGALDPHWIGYLSRRPGGLMDWHHLWVLVDLWVMGLLVLALRILWNQGMQRRSMPTLPIWGTLLLIAGLVALGQGSRYMLGSLFGHNLGYFCIGILVGPGNPVWQAIRPFRFVFLAIALFIIGLKGWVVLGPVLPPGELAPIALSRYGVKVTLDSIFRFVAILGLVYAFQAWWDKPHPIMTKLNHLIMPIYLWHMVVILLLAPVFVSQTTFGALHFLAHTFLTFTLSILLAELICRLGPVARRLHGVQGRLRIPILGSKE